MYVGSFKTWCRVLLWFPVVIFLKNVNSADRNMTLGAMSLMFKKTTLNRGVQANSGIFSVTGKVIAFVNRNKIYRSECSLVA